MNMPQRDYDVILYGASGFTGAQTVQYFRSHAPAGLRWAIGGRSREKLEKLHPGLPIFAAGSTGQGPIDSMVASTRVLLTTAGPFALYGENIVEACVRLGTHYADITGETAWVSSLIDRYHRQAEASGTRIVPFCGFDAVPSDLAAFAMSRQLGGEVAEIKAYFEWQGGSPNGGTLASGWNALDTASRAQMNDLFLLSPELRHAGNPIEDDPTGASFDLDCKSWIAPFVMSTINTRVVRRTCHLLNRRFAYQEYSKMGGPVAAHLAAGAGTALQAALKSSAIRSLLRRLTPAPGTGPTEAVMDGGWFRCHVFGRATDGRTAQALLSGSGDPANRITVKCLCEAALALACDTARLTERGGVLTPAAAMGEVLLERLHKQGITLHAK